MNKYSKKILDFFKNEKFFQNYKLAHLPIINKIKEHFLTQKTEQIKCTHSSLINKMHTYNDFPILYRIFIEFNKDNLFNIKNDIVKDVYSFNNWYRENFSNFNLKKMLIDYKTNEKYKKYYNILFKTTEEKKYLHEMLYKNSFVSLDVLQHAESEDLIYETYEGNNCKITLYTIKEKHINRPNFDIISKIITFMQSISKSSAKVNLIIFYGKQKKYVPLNKYFCPDNVNSGMSMSEQMIMIWRQEEFYKVLIHELVHYFNIDFYVMDPIYQKLYDIFKKYFNIDGVDRINESYTEALAILIHSILYATIYSVDIDTVIQNELLFTHFQVTKILNHFNIKNYNELKSNTLYQTTSVCSYYIIKCLLMLNYNLLFNFWNNNGYIVKQSETNYIALYEKILENTNINEEIVAKMIDYIKKCNNNFICKTMRMSLYQI